MAYAEETAQEILDNLAVDEDAFGPGRRNNDTVNALICCRILGLDFYDWHANVCPELQEHVERIEPYLDGWFSHGNDQALTYLV